VLERELADEALESRDARLIVGQHIGSGRVAVEPASLVLGDPDFNQVAADAVALGERMGRLSAQELLHDLALKLERMCAVLGHGLSPRKPGSVRRFSGPLPVHPEWCTPVSVPNRSPFWRQIDVAVLDLKEGAGE